MIIGQGKKVIFLSVVVILMVCFFQSGFSQTQNELLGIENYACYYGRGRIEDLVKFDMVILQDYYSAQEIATIKKEKTITLAYISLGEDYPLKLGDGSGPGGYASWYLDYFIGEGVKRPGKDNQPDKHENWISYFVKTDDINWHNFVIKQMERLISKGFDGVFLDVVGYPNEYPDELKEKVLKPGLLELIKKLRAKHPKRYLVVNGSLLLNDIHHLINGVMRESFSSTWKKHNAGDLAFTLNEAERINKIRGYPENPSMVVISLDYVRKGDFNLIAFDYERARSFGFIPSVAYGSTEEPDLCMVNPANHFKAKRVKDGVLLTWRTPERYLEESMVSYYIIKCSHRPILNKTDFKNAFLVSDRVPNNATSFKHIGAPKKPLYYALQAINKGRMELVGQLITDVKEK